MKEKSLSALGGWIGASFLIGIVLHSFAPEWAVDMMALSLIVIFCVVFLVSFWKIIWLRILVLCLLAIVVGVWRFEIGRPNMPRGLVPFSPNGLAYVSSRVTVADHVDPRHWLGRGRVWLTERTQKIFPVDEAALLSGVLYGERGLPKPIKDQFRRAGLLHIIAVSGSNMTIVVVFVSYLLLGLRFSRRTAFTGITLAIIAFVLFVDPSASVVRAAIMGWLIALAPVVGRIPRPSRLLLIAAVMFTLWKPWALLFDASFALSFLAMWGLLTWGIYFRERWMGKSQTPTVWIEIMAATMSATIMTVPYSAWAFGQLTLWGLVTSLIALPLVPWIMATGVIALIFSSVSWLTLPARGFLELLLWVGRWPDHFAFGTWSISFPFSAMIGVYVFLFIIWRYLQQRKRLIHSFSSSNKEKMLTDELMFTNADS